MSNRLLTSDDLDWKGSLKKKEKVDPLQDKQRYVATTTLNDMPYEVIENIISYFSFPQVLKFKLISKKWQSAIDGYITHAKTGFDHYFQSGEVEWIRLSPKYTELVSKGGEIVATMDFFEVSPRYSHNTLFHNGYIYLFGGNVTDANSLNDLFRYDIIKKKWQRILVSGNMPRPRAHTALHFYEFTDDAGKSRPSLIHISRAIVYPGSMLNRTQLEQLDPFEIYVFDIETFTWSKMLNYLCEPELDMIFYFSSILVGDELLIFSCTNNSFWSGETQDQKVYSLNLQSRNWTCQLIKPSPTKQEFNVLFGPASIVALDSHHIFTFNNSKSKPYMLERNRCDSCELCKNTPQETIEWNVVDCSETIVLDDDGTPTSNSLLNNVLSKSLFFKVDDTKFAAIVPGRFQQPCRSRQSYNPYSDRNGKFPRVPFQRNSIPSPIQNNRHIMNPGGYYVKLELEFFDIQNFIEKKRLMPLPRKKNFKIPNLAPNSIEWRGLDPYKPPSLVYTPDGVFIFGGAATENRLYKIISSDKSTDITNRFALLTVRPNLVREHALLANT